MVSRVDKYLDEYLRAISPLYRTQPAGFKLPVPRVKLRRGIAEIRNRPVEIRDLLEKRERLVIVLPKMYPDQGLPCVIAQDLIKTVISEKQPVPLFIDAKAFSPPQTLDALSPERFEQVLAIDGALPVLVIANVPLSSRTKTLALTKLLNDLVGFKVLVIVSEREIGGSESSFAASIQAESVSLERVSFREMAFFLQRNFSLPVTESEVIALRLNNAFTKFKLSSHPGFFAGLPKDTLAAFLQANRRSELLQLAVDGFLSFVVAGDLEREVNLVLSRTTRAKFLGELIFQIHVEKVNFKDSDLVTFAERFLKEYDYDIQPAKFVTNFIDNGIVAHSNGNARIALPFIEEYLLAVELRNNPSAALSYFDIDRSGFDKNTFDIYCELGPHENIVAKFLAKIRDSVSLLSEIDEPNVFLNDEISRILDLNDAQLTRLQNSLDKVIEEVASDKDVSQSKQTSLDIADAINERITEASDTAVIDKPEAKSGRDDLSIAYHKFACASLLLGSGAEYLKATPKRDLVNELVSFGDLLIKHGTRRYLNIDFSPVREELLKPESVAGFAQKGLDELEVKKLIEGFIDLFRRVAVSLPFYFVLGTICENASQRVLASSIKASLQAKEDSDFSKLFNAIWLVEADCEKGSGQLVSVVKTLPKAEFLRTYLVAHLITRVHWTHWKKPNRLALLDIADEVLKPLSRVNTEKGALTREVKSSDQREFRGEETKD